MKKIQKAYRRKKFVQSIILAVKQRRAAKVILRAYKRRKFLKVIEKAKKKRQIEDHIAKLPSKGLSLEEKRAGYLIYRNMRRK